jgi:GH24 family phage-related lysozyme (muramidase)
MTRQEWLSEVERRLKINEGSEPYVYTDSMGIPTIGIGFNLDRVDARAALAKIGVSDFEGILSGDICLTQPQIDALFDYAFAPIERNANISLGAGIFDALSDARRFVLCDLEYNLGQRGWLGFTATRAIINEAQASKNAGRFEQASALFGIAADHLRASAWDGQVVDRARRDEAMMRSSVWVDANGNGFN